MSSAELQRCDWCGDDTLYQQYHDEEWGVPQHDEQSLFEFLCLEGAQAGLSWITILRKRENYRAVFDDFEAEKMARYDNSKVQSLLADPGIVRNRLKVQAFISNAKAYLDLRDSGTSLDQYVWDFVDGTPLQNEWKTLQQVPAHTEISDRFAKDLKRRGFRFVGSTICYAFMQAAGLVNDHLISCHRYEACRILGEKS